MKVLITDYFFVVNFFVTNLFAGVKKLEQFVKFVDDFDVKVAFEICLTHFRQMMLLI